MEVYVNDESKLTLHGLVQHYTMLGEEGKNKRLMDLLDQLDFNQVGSRWYYTINMNNAMLHLIAASSSCAFVSGLWMQVCFICVCISVDVSMCHTNSHNSTYASTPFLAFGAYWLL